MKISCKKEDTAIYLLLGISVFFDSMSPSSATERRALFLDASVDITVSCLGNGYISEGVQLPCRLSVNTSFKIYTRLSHTKNFYASAPPSYRTIMTYPDVHKLQQPCAIPLHLHGTPTRVYLVAFRGGGVFPSSQGADINRPRPEIALKFRHRNRL